jgi:beta-galactosidase
VRCAYLGTDGDSPVLHTTELRAHPDGTVELTETVEVPALLRDLPRVGIELALAPGLEALTWFGRGPHDSYPDRWSGAAIGRWSSTVTGQYVPFVMPQEHGLHVDTRWFELRADDGHGVRIAAGPTFAFSARHHSAADLTAATHAEDLTPRAETIVDIDHRHRGLGTLSCGPDTLERYKIRPALHTWTWSIAPIVPGT